MALFADHEDEDAYVAVAREWQAKLFDAGWSGLTWPQEYGGQGLGTAHQIIWSQEASQFALPTEIFGIGLGMAGPTIISWGTEEQKARWLPPMLRGEEIWCQLFSEPNAGSDVAAVQTRARRDGDEWVVSGQKVWTSGARYSRWGMLLARTDPSVPKHAGLTYFVIDMHQPGVEVRPLRQMTGGANFSEVFLSEARVPHHNAVGEVGNGWTVALTTLMHERMSIGAMAALNRGTVYRALQRLVAAVEKTTGHGPLADPRLRARLVDVYVRGEVLRFMSQRMIGKLTRGEIPSAEGSAAKIALSSLLARLAAFAVDAQGPYGQLAGDDAPEGGGWTLTFVGYPGMRIAGGTDEIMKNIIGERVLGLPGEPRPDKNLPFADLPKN